MAVTNTYIGLKKGASANPQNVVVGSSSAGTAVDVELRIQIGNGADPTRLDVNLLMCIIKEYLNSPLVSRSLPI